MHSARPTAIAACAAALVFTLVAAVAGCAPDAPPAPAGAVIDDVGRVHIPSKPRNSIVSLVPSVTKTLVAMGAGDRLIARTQYDEQEELASLPLIKIGPVLSVSVEAVALMAPDLVVRWPSADGDAVGERLDDARVDWYGSRIQTIGDFERHAHNLGRLLGLEGEADSLIAWARADLAAAAGRVAGRDPASIFYVVQMDPPMTVGSGTFLDSVFVAAGASNVFADVEGMGNWPRISLEEAVLRDPDYIVVPVKEHGMPALSAGDRDPSADGLAAMPTWRQIRAVAEGRVISVDASLFGRPGPRMGQAVRYLAYRLHGSP